MADDAVERGRSALVRRCRSGGIERPRSWLVKVATKIIIGAVWSFYSYRGFRARCQNANLFRDGGSKFYYTNPAAPSRVVVSLWNR
jgi:hypothetical protein